MIVVTRILVERDRTSGGGGDGGSGDSCIGDAGGDNVTERSVGPAARCSKANKQARLVEREVCFISDAGHWGRGEDGRHLSKGLSHPC